MLQQSISVKTLSLAYVDEIYLLLKNHYQPNKEEHGQIVYSHNFLYWYLKQVPHRLIVGLTYQKAEKQVLVGVITANILDCVVFQTADKLAYIGIWCVQTKLRDKGWETYLLTELKQRLNVSIYVSDHDIKSGYQIPHKTYGIPINQAKLLSLGFITEPIEQTDPKTNPLHLMGNTDIDTITLGLNQSLQPFDMHIHFTNKLTKQLLFPKKSIVYSFVIKNEADHVTDFVSVYQRDLYLTDVETTISTAQLAYCFHQTVSLTQLVIFLLDKLAKYHFDQFIYQGRDDINLTRFVYGQQQTSYYVDGVNVLPTLFFIGH